MASDNRIITIFKFKQPVNCALDFQGGKMIMECKSKHNPPRKVQCAQCLQKNEHDIKLTDGIGRNIRIINYGEINGKKKEK